MLTEKLSPALLALEKSLAPSVLTEVCDPVLQASDVRLWLKRDDLLHPVISGNKWRKLKYNLDAVLKSEAEAVISMGGAYSNYLHALAYAGQQLGLRTIGVIRGEEPAVPGPALQDMAAWGMALRFVSRAEYRRYRLIQSADALPGILPRQYWLPEGGSSFLALQGVAELAEEIDMAFDILCVPCGTGATLAGLINAYSDKTVVLGFSALKNADYLVDDIRRQLTGNFTQWQLIKPYHFGGFAKISPILEAFMREFEEKTSILLEPVYTAKMLFGIYDLIGKQFFKPGSRIVAVHTGGLQGRRGFRL